MIFRLVQLKNLFCAVLLSGVTFTVCAQNDVPEILDAQTAIQRASDADADQYAPELIQSAREKLSQAQALIETRNGLKKTPLLAAQAQVDADLARIRSEQATVQANLNQASAEIDRLRTQLAVDSSTSTGVPTPTAASQSEMMP